MTELVKWARNQWDRVASGVGAVLGLVVLFLGWNGMSNALYPAEQLPYVISGGILGLFLLGAAATLWLSADLRDEWRKLDELTRIAAGIRPTAEAEPRQAASHPTVAQAPVSELDLADAPPLQVERSR